MHLTHRLYRLTLLASVAVSSISFAQGTAVITGTVNDAATEQALEDVVVTATSPALQGEEIMVTDKAGLYRIAQLPPGTYTLRLEKQGYKVFVRPDVVVRVDRTIRVNLKMQPESVQADTVEVVASSPTVDVGSTTTGVNVGKDFINKIAFIQPGGSGVRSFESLAAAAPQAKGDSYGYGFSGAQSPENLYMVDGMSVGDPAYGTNGAQFPVEFVEEANIDTGGYQAEYGRATGGVLNVVTKSGSNEFHGSVWLNWTPGLLSAQSKAINSDASTIGGQGQLWNTADLGAEVGGPIIKDKLWFYAGFSPSFSRDRSSRWLNQFLIDDNNTAADKSDDKYLTDDDGFIKQQEIEGTRRNLFSDSKSFSYIGKLTYLINNDQNLSLSVVGSPTTHLTPTFVPRAVSGSLVTNNSNTVSLKYTGGFLDKHLLVDANLGWFHVDTGTLPSDGSRIGSTTGAASVPAVEFRREDVDTGVSGHGIADFEDLTGAAASACDPRGYTTTTLQKIRGADRFVMACPATTSGATYDIGGAGYLEELAVDRYQAKGAVTYLAQALGHHIIKAGTDLEILRNDVKKAYSGGNFLRQNVTGSRFDDYRQFGYFSGADEAVQQKFIRQISSSIGIGAYVQDSWSIMDVVTLNAGVRYENQQLFGADGTLGMTLNNTISPRIGAIYDFTQQGRSKVFANYARFYEAVPVNIADRALSGENQYGFRRLRSEGCDPLVNISQANNECLASNTQQNIGTDFDAPYNAHQYGRLLGAGKTPLDPNLQPQSTDEIVLGGEYEVITDGRVGLTYTHRYMNYVIEDLSNDEGSTYFIGNPGYGLASAFPKAVRDYDAVTASFTKAFSDGWMGQASYTWSYLRGNYNGLFRPETDQLNPNINSDFDLKSLLANQTGPLGADRTHNIKIYGAKNFVVNNSLSFLVGLTYTGISGAPINYLASHPIYGADEAFVLPRGSGGRTPWVHDVNAKLGATYNLNKDQALSFTVDIFNVFNFQAVQSVDETISEKDLLPFVAPAGKSPQEAACLAGNAQTACANGELPIQKVTDDGVANASISDLNPNFKRPTSYQSPISVRFGLKFTF